MDPQPRVPGDAPHVEPPVDALAWSESTWLAAAKQAERGLDLAAATAGYHAALRHDPMNADALFGLSRVAARAMDHDGAVEWAWRAARARPTDLRLALHLVSQLEAARRLDEALSVLDELPPGDPFVCAARGSCLVLQGCLDEGLDWLRRAVDAAPESSSVRTALAVGLWRRHERYAALLELEFAHRLDPNDMQARFVLSHLRLELGDFEGGYADQDAFDAVYPPVLRGRRWRGEPVDGRTLLLYDQHGFGDAIQMVRYAEVCSGLGAHVILKVRSSLIPLLRCVRGVAEWHGLMEPTPPYDFQARLLDLPGVLGHTPDTVPRKVPYLVADPDRIRRVTGVLARLPRPWIGVAWRGNPRQKDGLIRTCRVKDLLPLRAAGFKSLVSLQHDATPAELSCLGAHSLPDLDRDGAFLDTAALIAVLDEVVTIDTSIAHLAGALGATVSTMLPYWGDWRWMADRDDTPWYPKMRLFRQPRPHDWEPVVASVLQTLVGRHAAPAPKEFR